MKPPRPCLDCGDPITGQRQLRCKGCAAARQSEKQRNREDRKQTQARRRMWGSYGEMILGYLSDSNKAQRSMEYDIKIWK